MQIIARWHGIVLCGMILLSAIQSRAANYFYDPGRSSGASWHGANAWSASGFDGPFDQTWVDGNTANFKFSVTKLVSLMGQNVTVAGIVNSSAASSVAITSTTGADLTFLDNAPIQGNTLQFGWTGSDKVTLRGPLTASCALTLREMIEIVGMVTLTEGTCNAYPQAMGSNTVFRLAGGNLNLANTDTYVTQSPIQIDSGNLVIGYYNATPIDATISSLSGSGGTVAARPVNAAADGVIERLTVDQNTNTTYSGTIKGVEWYLGYSYLLLTKRGTGELALAGTVNLRQGTVIEGGRLALNGGSTKQFHNLTGGAGSDAIRVASGGQLGGTATLSILGGTDVTVEAGGGLFAGLAGSAGRTTYAFEAGQGGTLDLSGMAVGIKGLHFDLGSNATAGTTYDQIKITGGTLALGAGVLGINDLVVNALPGLALGTYILIDSPVISGSLGSEVTGPISPDFFGTLRVVGNTLVLDVIGQPGTLVQIR